MIFHIKGDNHPTSSSNNSNTSTHTTTKYEKVVKVYEALSPQQAWQAVLLETIGLPDYDDTTIASNYSNLEEEIERILSQPNATITPRDSVLSNLMNQPSLATTTTTGSSTTTAGTAIGTNIKEVTSVSTNVATSNNKDSSTLLSTYNTISTSSTSNTDGTTINDESRMDKEELALRAKIREYRKNYFRALRNEQKAGQISAMKPRLDIDTIDVFNDDLVLRMIEGMRGTMECSNYLFISSREKDGGRKEQFNGLTRMLSKAKNCERLFIRNHRLLLQDGGEVNQNLIADYDMTIQKIPRVQKLNPSVILAMAKAKKRKNFELGTTDFLSSSPTGTPGYLNTVTGAPVHKKSRSHIMHVESTEGGLQSSEGGGVVRKISKFNKTGKKRRSGGPGSRGGKIKIVGSGGVAYVKGGTGTGVTSGGSPSGVREIKRRRKRRSPAAMAAVAAERFVHTVIHIFITFTQDELR